MKNLENLLYKSSYDWSEEKLKNLHSMIESKNRDTQYVAACLLRSNNKITNYKELLSKIPVCSRINSMKDILSEANISSIEIPYKNPTTTFEKYINACVIIPVIVSVYNEGWQPNWNNSSEYKYFPYFERKGSVWVVGGGGGWVLSSYLPASHYYKNRDILMEACKKFESIYNDWLNYIE